MCRDVSVSRPGRLDSEMHGRIPTRRRGDSGLPVGGCGSREVAKGFVERGTKGLGVGEGEWSVAGEGE